MRGGAVPADAADVSDDGSVDGGAAGGGGALAPGRGGAASSEVRVETLVAEQLKLAQLTLLESDVMTRGLEDFIAGEPGAIKDMVEQSLQASYRAASSDAGVKNKGDIERALAGERRAHAEQKVAARRKAAIIIIILGSKSKIIIIFSLKIKNNYF